MADQSDVENILVTTCAQILYPNGIGSPSVLGLPCKIHRGWPARHNLDADLRAKIVTIGVVPTDNERNTTRYLLDWKTKPSSGQAMTMTVDDVTVTIGGAPRAPLNAAVLVNGKGFVYPLQKGDTAEMVATGLATLISSFTPATSSGAVITIPAANKLEARIGSIRRVVQEIKRQQRTFRVILWCATPAIRDLVARKLDPILASLSFLSLPDGTSGRIRYEKTVSNDTGQKENLYRRDLNYSVEYGTTLEDSVSQILVQIFNLPNGFDATAPIVKTLNI